MKTKVFKRQNSDFLILATIKGDKVTLHYLNAENCNYEAKYDKNFEMHFYGMIEEAKNYCIDKGLLLWSY